MRKAPEKIGASTEFLKRKEVYVQVICLNKKIKEYLTKYEIAFIAYFICMHDLNFHTTPLSNWQGNLLKRI